ncbi:hypothetical protein NDR87_18875 [Nocardia sp. CDC159]|uniref:Uncharacterized protein n=1 Tax=Nocardia pulmonis TaxID=2951408 RepID=A0A9X2IZN7_9NOCA|nr:MULTISPECIES: hypothetical protein [Nocardia]MCM6776245.1 hypothetical protein [Nocardia pulmonis]MCM6788429.1 hypothetical protein [Nocardia sp. CDC159]
MRSLIIDAEDYRVTLRDGFSCAVAELDPSGRIRLLGYEDDETGVTPVYGSMHSLDAIDQFADALKAIVAHARGETDH